jgi:hypothetical protein
MERNEERQTEGGLRGGAPPLDENEGQPRLDDFDITDEQKAGQDSRDGATRAVRPVITFEYERYAPMLDDPALSEDQKRAFLQALWNIIVAFVDLGFEVHPVQLACGQVRESEPKAAERDGDLVQSDHRALIREFVETADQESGGGGKGFGA